MLQKKANGLGLNLGTGLCVLRADAGRRAWVFFALFALLHCCSVRLLSSLLPGNPKREIVYVATWTTSNISIGSHGRRRIAAASEQLWGAAFH